MLPATYVMFPAIFRKFFLNNNLKLSPMLKDNITLCLKIVMLTYVFIFPPVLVRNISNRAGCYNAFLQH
jgi:hypothetical protein